MARKMPGGCFAGELSQLGHHQVGLQALLHHNSSIQTIYSRSLDILLQAYDLGQRLRKRYIGELGFLTSNFQVGDGPLGMSHWVCGMTKAVGDVIPSYVLDK